MIALAITLAYAAEAHGFTAHGHIDKRLFRSLNGPAGLPARLPGAQLPWQTMS